MKYLVFTFGIVVSILFFSTDYKSSFIMKDDTDSDSMILWTNSRKLIFDDFKGNPPPKCRTDSLRTLAMTGTDFAYDYWSNEEGYVVNLECLFNKNRSWIRPEWRSNEQVINHEQRHFDLAEVYIRKVRKKFLDEKLEYLNYYILDSIMFSIDKELRVMEQMYDAEAGRLENAQMQRVWDLKIDSMLNVSNKYDSIYISWETE